MKKNPLLSGLTLSGGEPMEQPTSCLELAKAAHQSGMNVWCYTGYTWEELTKENDPDRMALLNEVDVLVDGPFILSQKSLELDYRGSKNQRLIDAAASRRDHSIVLWTPPVW